jgi:hypothetical protein
VRASHPFFLPQQLVGAEFGRASPMFVGSIGWKKNFYELIINKRLFTSLLEGEAKTVVSTHCPRHET